MGPSIRRWDSAVRSFFTFCCFLVALTWSVSASLQETGTDSGDISPEQIEAARSQVESAADLDQEAKDELLATLDQISSLLKFADNYAAKRESFAAARETANAEAEKIRGAIVEQSSSPAAEAEPEALPDSLTLSETESLLQQEKAELAAQQGLASDIANQLQREVSRPADIRDRITALTAEQASINEQLNNAPLGDALEERERRWLLLAQARNTNAELKMLDEEQLSRPMRQELLKARRDETAFRISQLRDSVKRYEDFAIQLRKGKAEEAATAAASAQAELEGRNPILGVLAQQNTELTKRSAELASQLQNIREAEQLAREGADRYEADLKALERKLEVVGMSQALGRILTEQQQQLPKRRTAAYSSSQREKMIAESSLRQIEYEEQRRDIHNLKDQVIEITADLSEADKARLEPEIRELLLARRDLIAAAIEGEESFLTTLGELDFASRRLNKAADSYSKFISERLLWIRTDSPLSWEKLKKLPGEIAQVLSPQAWWELLKMLPLHILQSVGLLLLILLNVVLFRARPWVEQKLEETAQWVGNVERDKLQYSFQGLGYTLLLALRWPLMFFTAGLALKGLAPASQMALPLSISLGNVSFYFLGLEVLRQLSLDNGLAVRHFQWSVSTMQLIRRRLLRLEQVFIPTVVLANLSNQLAATEADNMFVALMLIITQVALALFFARLPNFVESRLDTLLAPGRTNRRSIWARATRLFLIGVPCALILLMLLGYSGTAIEFLVLMLMTMGIFALLLIAHEFGLRWLRMVRQRLVKVAREEAAAAAALAAEADEDAEKAEPVEHVELDPDAIDADGRKLMSMLLLIGAIFGVLSVWGQVLPALGILNDVELWSYTDQVNGVDSLIPVTLADLGLAILMAFIGYVAVKRVPGLLELLLRQQTAMSAGAIYAASTLFSYVLIAGVVVGVLGMLGFAWSQIQWAVAALSVGIGFGLQEIVANFISGLILLFEQPIRVGDTVTVGETSGVVTRIRMRATTIRDWDRRELLVPNKEFITGRLLNWSLSDQITRFEIVAGVAYGTNLKKAMDLAVQAAKSHPMVLSDPAPFVTFDEFGDNSLKLVLRCFLDNVDKRLTTSGEVRVLVNDIFVENDIVVAFPQRDVHLDTTAPLRVQVDTEGGARPAQAD